MALGCSSVGKQREKAKASVFSSEPQVARSSNGVPRDVFILDPRPSVCKFRREL